MATRKAAQVAAQRDTVPPFTGTYEETLTELVERHGMSYVSARGALRYAGQGDVLGLRGITLRQATQPGKYAILTHGGARS